jgi:hypothetical protein
MVDRKDKSPLPMLSALSAKKGDKLLAKSIDKMSGKIDSRLRMSNAFLKDISEILKSQQTEMARQFQVNKEAMARQTAAAALKDAEDKKKAKKEKEGTTIRGGISRGAQSGIGSILGGIGSGLGLLTKFVAIGGGLASLGIGIGGFFTGLAIGEKAINFLGDGSGMKKLLTNVGEGLNAFDGQSLAALGVALGTSVLLTTVTKQPVGFKNATGMTMLGLGIGGFMAGMVAAGDITGFDGKGFKEQAKNIASGMKDFESLNETTLAGMGILAGLGALAGGAEGSGKTMYRTAGMGLAGFGIGAFMTGLVAAGDITGFEGKVFASQAKNLVSGLKEFESLKFSTKVGIGLLAAMGRLKGLPGGGIKADLYKTTGMGLAGFGIGAFMTGIAAAGDITKFDGGVFKTQAKNISDGLNFFTGGQLAGLTALMAAGGIFALVPGGGVAGVGIASVGMGLIGFGIGAFMSGIAAGAEKVISWTGASGDGMKTMMVNLAEGLEAFTKVDGDNLKAVGTGMAGLGVGMMALLVESGISEAANVLQNSWDTIIGWFSDDDGGQKKKEGKFDKLIEELGAFNGADFSGIKKMADQNLGESLGSIGEGMSKFTRISVDPNQLNNFINGPLHNLFAYAKDDKVIPRMDKMGIAIGNVAEAFTKFNDVDLQKLGMFSFHNFSKDFAKGASALDNALNGGKYVDGWSTSIDVNRGLMDNLANIEKASKCLKSLNDIVNGNDQIKPSTEALKNGSADTGSTGNIVNYNSIDRSVNTNDQRQYNYPSNSVVSITSGGGISTSASPMR